MPQTRPVIGTSPQRRAGNPAGFRHDFPRSRRKPGGLPPETCQVFGVIEGGRAENPVEFRYISHGICWKPGGFSARRTRDAPKTGHASPPRCAQFPAYLPRDVQGSGHVSSRDVPGSGHVFVLFPRPKTCRIPGTPLLETCLNSSVQFPVGPGLTQIGGDVSKT